MESNMDKIKSLLLQQDYTCVVLDRHNNIISSKENGIRPIMRLVLNDAKALEEAFIADKVIGAAAATIIIESDVKECYGQIMSESAINLLKSSNVKYSFASTVPVILNRDKTGLCPMEKMTKDLDSATAYSVLKEFFKDKF